MTNEEEKRAPGQGKVMLIMHIVAMTMYIFLGCLFVFIPQENFFKMDETASIVLGIGIILYGLFRGYRALLIARKSK